MIDLLPSTEQEQLAESIAHFLADNLPVDRFRRAAVARVIARPYFDEDDRRAVASDQIELAALAAKVALEHFIAERAEVLGGPAFRLDADVEMARAHTLNYVGPP